MLAERDVREEGGMSERACVFTEKSVVLLTSAA